MLSIAALRAIDELRDVLPDAAETVVEIARLLVGAGDAPRAAWLLEAGLRRWDREELRLALARVALVLGNPSLARETVAPVMADSEHHAASLVLRAQAELELGDLAQGLATLAEAERLHPHRPEARLLRIATLLGERRHDEARSAIAEALSSIPAAAMESEAEVGEELRARLRVTLAQLQAAQGEVDAALHTLRGVVRTRRSDLLAWRVLIQMLLDQERSAEALTLLEEALRDDTAVGELRRLLAEVRARLGHDAEAEAAFRMFVEQAESAAAYAPLVDFLLELDRSADALAVLDEATGRFPDEANLRLLRTEVLLGAGRPAEARRDFERFRVATFRGDPQVDYLRARIRLEEGDAEGAARRLAELAPRLDRASTQYWMGRALEELGDTEGARRRYGLARQRDPGWTAPADALLGLERRRGNWRAVVAHAHTLLALAPRQMRGWILLVEALENLGEGEAAEEIARRSCELFPDRAEARVLLAKALRARGRTDEALAALSEAGRIEETPKLRAELVLTLGLGGRVDEGIALSRAALADSAELHAALAALLFSGGSAEAGARETDRALELEPAEPRPLRVRCEFRLGAGQFVAARSDCARYLEVQPATPRPTSCSAWRSRPWAMRSRPSPPTAGRRSWMSAMLVPATISPSYCRLAGTSRPPWSRPRRRTASTARIPT